MIVHNDNRLCYQVQIPRHPLHPLSTSSLQRHLPNDDGQPPLTIDSLLVQATEKLHQLQIAVIVEACDQ